MPKMKGFNQMTDKKIIEDNKTPLYTLITSTIASFMGPFMISSVNIALPAIEKEYSADAVLLSWVVTAYILSYAAFMIPFGKISDMWGRKKTFLWGVIVFTLFSFVAPFSPGIEYFLVARFMQGIGSAMLTTSGLSMLTSAFPANMRGRVLGINTAAVYIGISSGPFFGGMLVHSAGWRSIFFATIPFGIAVIILILFKIKDEWIYAKGEKFDYKGSVVYGLSLASIMYASSILPDKNSIVFFICGFGGLILFVAIEKRIKNPVFEIRLFLQNRLFAFSNIAALINYSATSSSAFLLSLYLQKIKGFDPRHAGLILVIQPAIMAVFSPVSGRLSDKIEPRFLASAGMFLTSAGLFMASFLMADSSIPYIAGCLIFSGFGFALFSSPNMNSIMSSVEKRFYGNASASAGTMRLLGNILSMGTAIVVFTMFIGRAEITPERYPDLMRSIDLIFKISSVLCLAGVFMSLIRGNLRSK